MGSRATLATKLVPRSSTSIILAPLPVRCPRRVYAHRAAFYGPVVTAVVITVAAALPGAATAAAWSWAWTSAACSFQAYADDLVGSPGRAVLPEQTQRLRLTNLHKRPV